MQVFSVLLILTSGQSLAQEDFDYHPAFSDNFTISLGAFKSSDFFRIGSAGAPTEPGDDMDFGKTLGVDESATILNGNLRWKFGKKRKWSLSGQYFKSSNKGDAVLEEDIKWQGLTFREGTRVEAGVLAAVTRVFVGRSLVKNQQHDFGIGAGLHVLDLKAHIGGEVIIDDETTGFQDAEASVSQPLPNVGLWYLHSPARKWLIHGRADWISANIGDYDGTLWNVSAGLSYQAWRHISVLTFQTSRPQS